MKKLMSRCLVLVALTACLGLVSAADFRTSALDPPCPENCHENCRKDFESCREECEFDPECVNKKCTPDLNSCIAFCDWVCGPE